MSRGDWRARRVLVPDISGALFCFGAQRVEDELAGARADKEKRDREASKKVRRLLSVWLQRAERVSQILT